MKPLPRIVSLTSRDVPGGYELETVMEFPREGGDTILVRNFSRQIDLGDSYISVNHCARGWEPAETVLIFGKKGAIEGDTRTDETEMLVLKIDGTVERTEQTVKTNLTWEAIRDHMRAKYREGMAAGLTPDEIYRSMQGADAEDDHLPM